MKFFFVFFPIEKAKISTLISRRENERERELEREGKEKETVKHSNDRRI